MNILSYEEFEKVELRSGTILEAELFERAKKPAYRIKADFGEQIGILETSSQITINYNPDELLGKKIVGCVNLGEKNIAGFKSQFLLLGFYDKFGAISLISPDHNIENGQKLC